MVVSYGPLVCDLGHSSPPPTSEQEQGMGLAGEGQRTARDLTCHQLCQSRGMTRGPRGGGSKRHIRAGA